MASETCYSILYLSPGESREDQRINGYTTDKDLWKRILEADDYRFTASSLATDNGKYNGAAKGRVIRDGGIEKTSNGKDISKNFKAALVDAEWSV